MARKTYRPESAEAAWQLLLGIWSHRVEGFANDWSESRNQFTAEKKWIRTNSMAGGVLPGVQMNQSVTEIVGVALQAEAVVVTLGAKSNPLARPGGTMTIRFLSSDEMVIEDGPVFTRVRE